MGKGLKLLIPEDSPFCILPTLVRILGDAEAAVILQQAHYFLCISKHRRDGQRVFYMTHEQWHEQLFWIGTSTIRRKLESLRNLQAELKNVKSQLRMSERREAEKANAPAPDGTPMRCPSCGHEDSAPAKFCLLDGSRLEANPDAVIRQYEEQLKLSEPKLPPHQRLRKAVTLAASDRRYTRTA